MTGLYIVGGIVALGLMVYLVIAFVGFLEWSKIYRRQTVG